MRSSTFTHALMASAAIVWLMPSPAAAAVRSFDLPPLEAKLGVAAFARQSGMQLLASARELHGKRTNAVRGNMPVEDALRVLLAGTGLEARYTAGGVMTVRLAQPRAATIAAVSPISPTPGQAAGPSAAPQDTVPSPDAQTPADAQTPPADIVVTGIRQSLTRAAEIKQDAVEVVDSIVAQDIGKLPDPTTAAALQRVPGIQVSVNRNNELGDVRVRGLPDVLTTVNGREVFTTAERTFNLQDIPAEALSGVDVYKSQSPTLIEGGLAGVINLKLNRPFDFRKPTLVLSARGNYGVRSDKLDPNLGALVTRRWDTGIGEIGALVDVTWQRNSYQRDQTILLNARSSAAAPLNVPGYVIPNILQNFPEQGKLERTQANAAFQWQATPELEAYVDLLYTRSHDRGARYGANIQAFTTGATLTNVTATSDCYPARVAANGQNPTITTNAQGQQVLSAYTVQNLCQIASGTLTNAVVNQTTQARDVDVRNKQVAGGLKYDQDGTTALLDIAYQTSRNDNRNIVTPIAQRLPSVSFVTEDDGGAPHYTIPGDALLSRDNVYVNNQLQQNYGRGQGSLWQTKADVTREVGGLLKLFKLGARYARRSARSQVVSLNTAVPGGSIGTATEARAVKVSATGLPDDYIALGSPAPGINDGTAFYVPNPAFLLDESKLDLLRGYFKLGPGRPAFARDSEFNARETTIAAYAELDYEVALGGTARVDGIIGGRLTQTKRSITTYTGTTAGGTTTYAPNLATTTDRDFLPAATARLRVGDHFQARLGYSKSIRRPNFGDLNPAVRLNLSNNPFVQSGGSGGNPNLKEQKSDSIDATLEYYLPRGYIALAAYKRNISNRVLTGAADETIGGVSYSITRPRNLGEAQLQGVELSGQYFADFLPGVLSGFGVQGAFTLADSTIKGSDPLAGNPLQGVSKYNFTTGLLYDKFGISGRLVYTYRSRYFDSDQTGSVSVRPIAAADVSRVFVPTLLSYVRPAGRLDFNVGYDVTPALRIDVGGTNILRSRTRSYLGQEFANFETLYDETVYSLGIRLRL